MKLRCNLLVDLYQELQIDLDTYSTGSTIDLGSLGCLPEGDKGGNSGWAKMKAKVQFLTDWKVCPTTTTAAPVSYTHLTLPTTPYV